MSEAVKTKKYKDLWKELCILPDNVVGEILNGELIVSPRPAPRHARASSSLGGVLHGPFDHGKGGPGGWWILDEPEIHWGETVIVPDLAGWKRDRLLKLPDTAYFELAPDWVCEVLSPSTVRHDRISKLQIYTANKVPHYWIIDPVNKTLETFVLDGGGYRLGSTFGEDDSVSVPPFEVIKFDLSELWAD